jgi:transposase
MSGTPPNQLSTAQLLRQLAEAQAERDAARAARDAAQHKVQDQQEELHVQALLIRQLHLRLRDLSRKLAAATNRATQQVFQWQLDRVQKRLDELNRERFGTKSERLGKRVDNDEAPHKGSEPTDCDSESSGAKAAVQPSTDASGDAKPTTSTSTSKKQTGHGPTPQPDLISEEQLHLLPDGTDCTQCGGTLKPWEGRTQDSEEVDVIERTYRIKVHKHQTYRCRGCGHLETALSENRLVPGGRYSVRFAISVAVDKYRDALPLARQVKRMASVGLKVTTQTLWDQINALATLLHHNYLALQTRLLEQEVLHADETPWRLMKKGGSKRWCCSTAGVGADGRAACVLSPRRVEGTGPCSAAPRQLFRCTRR